MNAFDIAVAEAEKALGREADPRLKFVNRRRHAENPQFIALWVWRATAWPFFASEHR